MKTSGAILRALLLTVVAAGFVIAAEGVTMKSDEQTTLKVDKVTCTSSCSTEELTSAIETALRKVPGVKTVTTDLQASLVTVTHEPGKATLGELTAAAQTAGFVVSPASDKQGTAPVKKTPGCCVL